MNCLVLDRRAPIQFLRGFEHHARRMIDAAMVTEIDAIDYPAVRPEFIDANGHLTAARCTRLKPETDRCLPRQEHGGCRLHLR